MSKEIISTKDAPSAIGPYSQAVKAGGFLFLSGQIGLNPKTMELVGCCAACQAKQIMDNIAALLASQGLSMDDVVRMTVYLRDMNDFGTVNEVYARYFKDNPPARSCVEVSRLPKDVLVEIEATALCK
ncbi:MAG: RidA family protein [Synergistes sp.]|nr:RidA family protein [Synergistes sp.]